MKFFLILISLLLIACEGNQKNSSYQQSQEFLPLLIHCATALELSLPAQQQCAILSSSSQITALTAYLSPQPQNYKLLVKWLSEPDALAHSYRECLQTGSKLSKRNCDQAIELTEKTAIAFYNTHLKAFIADQAACYKTSVLLDTPTCLIMGRLNIHQGQQLTAKLANYLSLKAQRPTLELYTTYCQDLYTAPLLSLTQVFYKSTENVLCTAVAQILIQQFTEYYKGHKTAYHKLQKLCANSIYNQLNPTNQFNCYILRQITVS